MLSIYNASAGSGKTFALTREYLRMLLRDTQGVDDKRLPHSRILAVTFTKKSTAEMKERILRELYILSTDPNQSDYIKDFCQDATLNLTQEQIQQRAQHLLVGILQDYTRFLSPPSMDSSNKSSALLLGNSDFLPPTTYRWMATR